MFFSRLKVEPHTICERDNAVFINLKKPVRVGDGGDGVAQIIEGIVFGACIAVGKRVWIGCQDSGEDRGVIDRFSDCGYNMVSCLWSFVQIRDVDCNFGGIGFLAILCHLNGQDARLFGLGLVVN